MELFVVMLLASLSTVLGILGIFLVLYRRELRRLRHAGGIPAAADVSLRAPRRPLPFPLPDRWMAIRGTPPELIRRRLRGRVAPSAGWADALARCREGNLFVSPQVDGWTLVIGSGLPDVFQDVDATYRFLRTVSESLGTVQFFAANRVLHSHAWARLDDGQIARAYAWAGTTLWNEGKTTLEERLLGLRCRAYGEEVEAPRYGEISPDCHNTERLVLLARRWGIDPVVASELLLHHEGGLERGRRWTESDREDPDSGASAKGS